jgi:K+-transporting ATPase KdpF subunit
LSGRAKKFSRSGDPFMTNLIVGIIALALIVYLIFTIIRPEKF